MSQKISRREDLLQSCGGNLAHGWKHDWPEIHARFRWNMRKFKVNFEGKVAKSSASAFRAKNRTPRLKT